MTEAAGEFNEADALEQGTSLDEESETELEDGLQPIETDQAAEGDAIEQRLEVPADDEDAYDY